MKKPPSEPDFQPFRSPADYREWSRTLDRLWLSHLTPMEFGIIRFIFDRTAGWSKEWETIPIHHFTEGVVARDGREHGKLNSARKETVRAHLESLTERGVLLRRPCNRSFAYSLNYEWDPAMKIPKRLKTTSNGSLGEQFKGSLGEQLTGSLGEPKEEREEKPFGKRKLAPAELTQEMGTGETREQMEAALSAAASRSASRRATRSASGYACRGADGGIVPSDGAMRRLWTDLHVANFPGVPVSAFSTKAIAMLRGYAKEWNLRHPGEEFTSYLTWLFENWHAVRVMIVGWMPTFPDYPEPMLVANAKMRPHIEEGWSARARLESLRKLSPREREIRELIRQKGMDRETAERLIKTKEIGEAEMRRAQELLAGAQAEGRMVAKQREAFFMGIANLRKPVPLKPTTEEEEEALEKAHLHSLTRSACRAALSGADAPQRQTVEQETTLEQLPAWDEERFS